MRLIIDVVSDRRICLTAQSRLDQRSVPRREKVPLRGYPGEEAVLEMVMLNLKDRQVPSLKALIFEAENLLELVF